MEDRITRIIYYLYELRENPSENLDKIPRILDQLAAFDIESLELSKILKYRSESRRMFTSLKGSRALKKCVNLFLSKEDFLQTEEVKDIIENVEHLDIQIDRYILNLEKNSLIGDFLLTLCPNLFSYNSN